MEKFTHYAHLNQLDEGWQSLIQSAIDRLHYAYAPYSKFMVSAALLMHDDTMLFGTNQENAAYPSGLCAERVAVFAAQSQFPDKKIKRIAIVAKPASGTELASGASCGACRQVMLEAEFRQHQPIQIAMLTAKEQWTVAASAESLLPFAFNKNNLISHY
jgi:cytidine deaminase